MSRVGKKTIALPKGVEVKIDNTIVTVTGQYGQLLLNIKPFISVEVSDDSVNLSIEDEGDKMQKAIWGTTRALIANNIIGVSQKFQKEVELNGVGYRMELGEKLTLYIGFSHPVVVDIPKEIKLTLNKNLLTGESIDKQLIGDFFTTIHDMKPCDVYKHKGFKFPGRFYAKKAGKKAK